MKLHLPKLLRAAVIAAISTTATTYGADATYINVGLAKNKKVNDNLVLCDDSYMEASTLNEGNKALQIGDGDLVGYFSEVDPVTNEPKPDSFKTKFDGTSIPLGTAVISNSFKVNGDLEITGTGKVYIGGKSDGNFYSYLEAKNVTITGTGTASSTSVQNCADLNLRADSGKFDTFTMNSGAAFLCTYESGGGDDAILGILGPDTTDSSKSVYIKGKLTVNNGYLQMGYNSSTDNIALINKHFRTFLGGDIEQNGGTILSNGKVYLNASTITQTGGKMTLANNTSAERLVIAKSTLTIHQGVNDKAPEKKPELIISGKLASTPVNFLDTKKGNAVRTLNIVQECEGTISIQNGVLFTSSKGKESSITQTGGGTVNLTGDFSSAVFNIDLTNGTLSLTSSGTSLKSYTMTLASGVQLDNNGKLTVGTGAAGAAGVLNVTTGGALNLVLDCTNAAINVGAASDKTKTVTGWEMAAGSTLGIGLTESGLGKTTISAIDGSDKKKIVVTDALVATVASGSNVNLANFKCQYEIGDINGSDVSQWQMESESTSLMKVSETGNIVLGTTLIYNPWIEITDGVERNADIKDTYVNETTPENSLLTGLAISGKNVTLSGNNSYSYGTKIDGVTVTLAHENALGTLGDDAEIATSGKAGLIAAPGTTANLPGVIQNSGELTMQGSFKADNAELCTDAEELFVDAKNTEGENGFKREDTTYQIVENNGTGATLTVGSGTTVQVGAEKLQLFTDGVAGSLDYDTYYINNNTHTAKDINAAAEGKTTAGIAVTAEMKGGTLEADESIKVKTTDGTLITTGADTDVSGSVANTTVQANGGTISADISGTSSVTVGEDTTLSGNNTYEGTTTVKDATLTLASKNALGKSSVTTEGTTELIADGVTANLSGTITNKGALTMQGDFSATSASLGGETDVKDSYFALDGTVSQTDDGFKRDGGKGYLVVDNGNDGTLTLNDVTLKIDSTDYNLYENGYAGMTSTDYSTYHINSDTHSISVSTIITASQQLTENRITADSVFMTDGTLEADASIEVETTGGTLITTGADTDVSGSVANTTVQANGGTISADISGTSSVTVGGDTTLSGDNTYEGATTVKDATLTLASENALGKSAVTTEGTTELIADGVTANLSGTITNKGALTMQGSYSADGLDIYSGEVADVYLSVDETEGDDGFKREGATYQVVKNEGSATLTLGDGTSVTVGADELKLFTDGLAGEVNYDTYYLNTNGHKIAATQINDAADGRTTNGVQVTANMKDGELTADASIQVESTGGTLVTTGSDTDVSGSVADTTVLAGGGTISADISGSSKVTVTGDTTFTGDNSYTKGTQIDGAKLTITQATGLGTGYVELLNHATLDLSGQAVSNNITVSGCTLSGASAYTGNLDVTGNLNLTSASTANSLRLRGAGTVKGGALTVNSIDVRTDKNATISTNLTVNNNGTITLNNGKVLNVQGSVTLRGITTLKLNGNYRNGTKLVTGTNGLETGTVKLVYDPEFMLEEIGNSLVLTLRFQPEVADPVAQGNWGIATASRAFVDTVRGQRNNTGCIANGRGTTWFSVLGASNNLDGADISIEGAAVGADYKLGRRSLMGIALGYTEGKVSPTGLSKVNQDGYYAAVYGEHGLTSPNRENKLSVDWVLAYGSTESQHGDMNWEQDSLQLNSRLTWSRPVNKRLTTNAFVGLEYFATASDTVEGVKTGSIQNLRAEVGIGAGYVLWGSPSPIHNKTAQPMGNGCEKLVLHGELSYFNDLVRQNPIIRMNGASGESTNPGRNGVEAEIGATYRINERWSTSANYSFSAMEDSTEHRVNVGAAWSF